MTQPRIFLQPGEDHGERLRLGGDHAHYLARVVRAKPGDLLVAVAADGAEVEARVDAVSPAEIHATVLSRCRPEREPRHEITLALAVLKAKAMDWAVQKATEVGVARIVPILSSRVVVRGDDRRWQAKRCRWQQIALEAARQSRRTRVPAVDEPVSIRALADRCRAGGAWLLLDPDARRPLAHALTAPAPVGIIVGPEGDLDPAEKALLRSAGAIPIGLGPRLLRAETAGVVACALVLYLLGDMQ